MNVNIPGVSWTVPEPELPQQLLEQILGMINIESMQQIMLLLAGIV